MKLELVTYTCGDCAFSFDAASLGETAYGEFLLWSKNAEIAYLNAFTDGTYKSVDRLLLAIPEIAGLNPLLRSEILQEIYGRLACDFDSKGDFFQISGLPPCPACGSQNITSWRFKNPPEVVEIDIPPVSHKRWEGLSDLQRKIFLNEQLAESKTYRDQAVKKADN